MLSSPSHTLGPPTPLPRLPHSTLQKPHMSLLPHRAPLPPFLPEAGLHRPSHWSLPFLFVIPNAQARLRLEQGHPLFPTSVLYLCLIWVLFQHLSKCRNGHSLWSFVTHSPRKEAMPGLLHSSSLLSDLHPSVRAEDRKAWGNWPTHCLSLTPAGSPILP